MDKSGMLVGGTIGAVIVAIIFAVILLTPTTMKSEIIASDKPIPSAIGETTPAYSKNISLIEIFEKSEPGVVRVNVQRIDQTNGTSGVGSGFVFDKFTDIGVVKVNADLSLLQPLVLGDSSNLKVGEPIAAIGNPFGLSGSMTSGIVSQLGRLLPSGAGYSIPDVIQTDAAINPGNSGGPLLNMRGEIVGINTAIQSTTGEFTGVGFAVPSQTIAKIVPSLIENGKYHHPWIGISGRDIDPDLAKVLDLKDAVGFLVITVVENSPAAKAGIHGSDEIVQVEGVNYPIGGDIILSVDGKQVRKIDDILIYLQRAKSVGVEMNLEILRGGRTTNITLTLEERPNGN